MQSNNKKNSATGQLQRIELNLKKITHLARKASRRNSDLFIESRREKHMPILLTGLMSTIKRRKLRKSSSMNPSPANSPANCAKANINVFYPYYLAVASSIDSQKLFSYKDALNTRAKPGQKFVNYGIREIGGNFRAQRVSIMFAVYENIRAYANIIYVVDIYHG